MSSTVIVRGGVRVRPAPAYDPPYDDERPPDWRGTGAGQPLLEFPPPAGQERRTGVAQRPAAQPPEPEPPPAASASPETASAAARFINTCLEILNGYRPLTHVRELARPLEAAAVLEAMTLAVRRVRPVVRRGGLVKLRTMRTCEPRPGVAEIAVVVGGPDRARPAAGAEQVWAMAYRLERHHGRWRCTAARML